MSSSSDCFKNCFKTGKRFNAYKVNSEISDGSLININPQIALVETGTSSEITLTSVNHPIQLTVESGLTDCSSDYNKTHDPISGREPNTEPPSPRSYSVPNSVPNSAHNSEEDLSEGLGTPENPPSPSHTKTKTKTKTKLLLAFCCCALSTIVAVTVVGLSVYAYIHFGIKDNNESIAPAANGTVIPTAANITAEPPTLNTDPVPTCFSAADSDSSSFCGCSEVHYNSSECLEFSLSKFANNTTIIDGDVTTSALVCERIHGYDPCFTIGDFKIPLNLKFGFFSYAFTYECQRSTDLSTEIGYDMCRGHLTSATRDEVCFPTTHEHEHTHIAAIDACDSPITVSVIPDPDPRSFCGCSAFNAAYPVCMNESLAFFTPTNVVLSHQFVEDAFSRCEELNGCIPCAKRPIFGSDTFFCTHTSGDCKYEFRFADQCIQSLLGPDPESERCNNILANNLILEEELFNSCFISKPVSTNIPASTCPDFLK